MHGLTRRLAASLAALLACVAAGTANAAPPLQTVVYDDFQAAGGYTLGDYGAKWANIYGLGDMAAAPGDTRSFADGTFSIADAR